MTDAEAVAAAKAALAAAATLNPVEGTNANVIPMAQAIADGAASGVVVTVSASANSQVASPSGDITYGGSAVTGNVTFTLTKSLATDTQVMSVVVPAHTVTDAEAVAAAKAALAAAATLNPVEGTNANVIPMAQAIADGAASGVVVTVSASANSQVASPSGDITYGGSAVTGNVTFTLTKSLATDTQVMSVVVPAHTVTDAEAIAVAKAALAAAATLNPVEGTNANVIPMAQAIADGAASGVVVTVSASANSQVASPSGDITYGGSAVTGNVTFTLTKNAASDTQVMSAVVPAAAKPFTITGSLDRMSGIKATATVNRTNALDHSGTEVVIFQLMRNGTEPVSIVALQKDITSSETLIAHFNVSGQEYTVKVFVFDQFTSETGSASTNLAVPQVLQ